MAIENIDSFLSDLRSAKADQGDRFDATEFSRAYDRGANRSRTQPESADSLSRKGFIGETTEALAGGVLDAGELWMRAVRAVDPQGGNDTIRDFATYGIDAIKNFVAKHPSLSPDTQAQEGVSRWWQQGVRALVPSLSAVIPGVVGGAVAGPIGATVGGGAISGAIFGLAEFDKFHEEVEERIVELGLSEDEAIAMRAEARNPAIYSALTEGGLEAAANALQVRTLGKFLPGRKTLKNLIKRPVKDIFQKTAKEAVKTGAKQLALTTPVEVGTEFAQSALETKFRRDIGLTDMDSWGAGIDALGPAFVTNLLFFGMGKSANAAQRWGIRHSLEDAKTDPNKRMKAVRDISNIVRGMEDVNAEGIANKMEAVGLSYVASGMSIDINNDLGMETMLNQFRDGLQDGTITNITSNKLRNALQQEMDREALPLQQRIPAFQMYQGLKVINDEQQAIDQVRKEEKKDTVEVEATGADMLEQNAKRATDKQAKVTDKVTVKKEEKKEKELGRQAVKGKSITKKAQEDLIDTGNDATTPDATKDKERQAERVKAKKVVPVVEVEPSSGKPVEKPPVKSKTKEKGEIKEKKPETSLTKDQIKLLREEVASEESTFEEKADARSALKLAGVAEKAPVKKEDIAPTGLKSILPVKKGKKGEKETAKAKEFRETLNALGLAVRKMGAATTEKARKQAVADVEKLQKKRNLLGAEAIEGVVKEDALGFDSEGGLFDIFTNGNSVQQEFTGTKTSLTQKTAGFNRLTKQGKLGAGTTNVDLGGGRGNLGGKAVKGDNVVLDPFNRSHEHNAQAIKRFQKDNADSATIFNVLNVIKEDKNIHNLLKQARALVKRGGEIHIEVFEGDRKGVGHETRKGYQRNQKLLNYIPFVKEVFGDKNVYMNNGTITATNEKPLTSQEKKIMAEITKNHPELTKDQANLAIGTQAIINTQNIVKGNAISPEMMTKGKIEINGKSAATPEEVATLAQVFRNPQYETFRLLYVRDGKVVGHEARTSRLPGTVKVFIDDQETELSNMRAKQTALQADTVWLLHNHPSGNAKPSPADMSFTKQMADRMPLIKGHVIIDSGEYSHIKTNGTAKTHKLPTNDAILRPSVPNALLGKQLESVSDVIRFGKELHLSAGYVTATFADTNRKVRGIADIPVDLLKKGNIEKLNAEIRELSTMFGSVQVILALDTALNPETAIRSPEELIGMIENGIIVDAILYKEDAALSLQQTFDIQEKQPSHRVMGEDIQTFVEEPRSNFEKDGGKTQEFTDKDFSGMPHVDRATQDIFNNKLGPKVKGETFKEKWGRWTSNWKLKIQQGAIDQYASLKKLDDRLWKLAQVTTSSSGAVEALLTMGPLKLTEGVPDIADPKGSKGLFKILKPLGEELELFLGWIAGNRAARLEEGKEKNLTEDEITRLVKLNEGKMKDGRSRKSVYRQALRDLNVLHKSVLDLAVETGTINKEEMELWDKDFYLPFFRHIEETMSNETKGPKTLGGIANQTAFKELKGKDVPVADMLTNIILNWNHLVGASMKNQVAAKTVKMAANEKFPDGDPVATKINVNLEVVKDEETGQFKVIDALSGKNRGAFKTYEEAQEHQEQLTRIIEERLAKSSQKTIFVRENGKKVWYEINEPNIYQALTNLNFEGFNNMPMRAMRKFKRALTFGVTSSPEFKIRNLFRDTISSAATSKISLNLFDNVFGTGAKTQFSKDSLSRMRMMAGGGEIMFGHLYGTDPEKLQAQLQKNLRKEGILDNPTALGKMKDRVSGLVDKWNDLGSKMENLNRGALFEQTLEKEGFLEANFGARDLLDFNRHGAWPAVRFLIDVVPFMNARIQGLDKLKRSMTKEQGKRLAVVLGGVAMASMALYLAYKDDDEFKEREEWDRDTYWWFKLPGSDNAIRLPKPFEIGVIGTMAERLLEQAADDEVHGDLFAERLKFAITETFSLGITPQAVKPVLELMANKNFFTDRPIETLAMENLSPTERRKAWTSETAIGLSKGFSHIPWEKVQLSPVQVEHLVQGYLGWVGASVLGAVDQIFTQPLGGFPSRPSKRIEEYPLIGSFVRTTPSRQTKYSSLFYEGLKEMNQTWADVRNYRTLGETDKALALARKEKDTLRFRKLANKIQKNVASVTKRIRLTRLDKNMSKNEKRVKIDRLTVMKNKLLKMAVKKITP